MYQTETKNHQYIMMALIENNALRESAREELPDELGRAPFERFTSDGKGGTKIFHH